MVRRTDVQLTSVERYAVELIGDIHQRVASGDLPMSFRRPARLMHHLIVIYHGHPGLRVSKIAPQLGTTLRTLERDFRGEFLVTMKIFQIQTRVKYAQTLLTSGEGAKMIVIAKELGYNDPNIFERFFRCHVGESPSAWRKAEQERRNTLKPHDEPSA